MRKIWFILILILPGYCYGQVEHNFPVSPQYTNCDSIRGPWENAAAAISMIQSGSFRFEQSFKISRIKGLRRADFHSCDGKTGFMIVKIGEKNVLFQDIPKTVWDSFLDTSDPDGFYQDKIISVYTPIYKPDNK